MEHTKKFMLVDPQFHRPTTIKEKTLSKLDNAIEEVLQSDLADDEKAKRYTIALNKFRAIEEYTPSSSESLQNNSNYELDVIRSVPPAQQYKARRLLDYLKKDPEIQWSDRGELIHRQNLVQNSNVVDLVSDILRKSTAGENPEGWQEVADSLSKTNVPKEFVPNVKRWRYMHAPLKRVTLAPLAPRVTSKNVTPKVTSKVTPQFTPRVADKTRHKRRRILVSDTGSINWIPYR